MDAPTPSKHATTRRRSSGSAWIRALRPHHWSKNLLAFVPAIAAHRLGDPVALAGASTMFAALCLSASAVYVLNDIADRAADAQHPRKRARPFATGELSPRAGVALALASIAAALALVATTLPAAAFLALVAYVAGAELYTLALKRRIVLDVAALAALYTLRLVAGGAAIGVTVSSWLLSLSLALFASIALAKRRAELREPRRDADAKVPGRGYAARDLRWLRAAGLATGALAALLVLAYASSPTATRNYAAPAWLYALAPIVLAWILRLWTRAGDGRMHHDPVVDAATDPVGLVLVAAGVAVLVAAL